MYRVPPIEFATFLQRTPGPDWAAIIEAVGTALSALVLIVGAVFAERYIKRANASVVAVVFPTANGLALHVCPRIQSSSLVRLHLAHEGDEATISVTEQQLHSGSLLVGEPATRMTLQRDDVVDPGETVTDSEIFLVTSVSETLGWRVEFLFAASRWPRSRGLWYWVATTFVPAPHPWPDSWPSMTDTAGYTRDAEVT